MGKRFGLQIAPLTPRGRGAVATIGVRGDLDCLDGHFQAVNQKVVDDQELNRICFGTWGATHPEEVVFVRLTETNAEVYCHGGEAAVRRIVTDLADDGAEVISWREWHHQGNARIDCECMEAVIQATTVRTAHILLNQVRTFPAVIRKLLSVDARKRGEILNNVLRWAEFGLHLTRPWNVVLCGRPNVGKSSLVNALVGFSRSVVYDQPGTTRDIVSVETAIDGWPMQFSDTAGIREQTEEQLESAGIARARERLADADLQLIVLDAASGLTDEDRTLMESAPDGLIIWNKCDLKSAPKSGPPGLTVSALAQTGIAELIAAIVSGLVPEFPDSSVAIPVSQTQIDTIRKLKALHDDDAEREFETHLRAWVEQGASR